MTPYDDLLGDYVSPDGQLCFKIIAPKGDLTMGFDGYPSHTHGDILAELAGGQVTAIEATRKYLSRLLSNKLVIAVSTVEDKIRDIWLQDQPTFESRYFLPGEKITFRLWNGAVIEGREEQSP